jgi:hypothetical protein
MILLVIGGEVPRVVRSGRAKVEIQGYDVCISLVQGGHQEAR